MTFGLIYLHKLVIRVFHSQFVNNTLTFHFNYESFLPYFSARYGVLEELNFYEWFAVGFLSFLLDLIAATS